MPPLIRILLSSILVIITITLNAQLANTTWSIQLSEEFSGIVFFGTDEIFYVDAGDGTLFAVATYTDDGTTFTISDIEPKTCPETGTYTYVITGNSVVFTEVNDPCTDRMQLFTIYPWTLVLTTGIGTATSTDLVIYPVPSNGEIVIGRSLATPALVRISDMNGRVVSTSRIAGVRELLDLRWLASGSYVLEVISDAEHRTRRIVIE